jgi:anti-sigma B factor antagonist
VAVLAQPSDAVDECVDHPACRRVVTGAVLERPHAEHEPVVEHIGLEPKDGAVDRRRDGRRGKGELVDSVHAQVQARTEATEDEGYDACATEAGGNGEKDRVRHRTVPLRDGRSLLNRRLMRAGGATTIGAVPESPLMLSTEQAGGVSVIHVTGDLDLSTIDAFDAELEQLLESERLVIELAQCTFIDSSALRALVRAQKLVTRAGGELALVAPSQPARRVLEIATLDRFVPVFGTVGEAVTSFA